MENVCVCCASVQKDQRQDLLKRTVQKISGNEICFRTFFNVILIFPFQKKSQAKHVC